ncbi:hypothetical protein QYZ88_016015 [Lachnospiraceae bacterium C1.1]|nr:hypothetical protein [Lachnospiraceae bacterium C1.1]
MENGGIMKSFDEFKSEFRDKLLNELEKRIKMPLDCKRHDISKVNEKYESLTIGPEGSNVSVNARLDKAFESYRDGNTTFLGNGLLDSCQRRALPPRHQRSSKESE